MKTFEDALKLSVRVTKPENLEDEKKIIEDTFNRYGGIAEEAKDAKAIRMVTDAMCTDMIVGNRTINNVLFTMFMLGLQTGVEMEKAE